MKKQYITPASSTVAFDVEASMMTTISSTEKTTQSDDWSNQRQWSSSQNNELWGDNGDE